MKNRLFFYCISALLLLGGCRIQNAHYLPTKSNIGTNRYGSRMDIRLQNGRRVLGELIAIDTSNIIILRDSVYGCKVVPIRDVETFRLMFAKPTDYSVPLGLGTVSTFSHGYWLVFTLPINIIAAAAVSSSSKGSVTYSQSHITLQELQMFARFPQGVPEGVDVGMIGY